MPLSVIKFDLQYNFLDKPGQRAGFVVLAAFLATFLFIRTSARLMRNPKITWWPGSVTTESGLHLQVPLVLVPVVHVDHVYEERDQHRCEQPDDDEHGAALTASGSEALKSHGSRAPAGEERIRRRRFDAHRRGPRDRGGRRLDLEHR